MRASSGPRVVVTLMALGCVLGAAWQEEMLEVPEVGMSMSMPAGWQPGGVSGESILASYTAGSGLYPGLNVTIEDRAGRSLAQVRDTWLGLLSRVTVHSQAERTVSGKPALFIDAAWGSLMGDLRALRLFVEHGEKVIVITFADRGGDLDEASAAAYAAYLESVAFE